VPKKTTNQGRPIRGGFFFWRKMMTIRDELSGATTLCEGWRLRTLDHLQWVVERRVTVQEDNVKRDRERWLPQAYCRTKLGIKSTLSCFSLRADPVVLAGLPEHFDAGAPAQELVSFDSESEPSRAIAAE
jgi:hypothetical protein